ncbi:phage major capsid protein [Salmonella enterica subsp. enterica]|nr:phage major capsid protein [Salmonella enterica subsp. enterica]ECI7957025.1 phage major capsid protein [Salmonella enterica subsp. enterica]ECJ5065646.1 phage major capsid protein [Salmonella enterica subsp. enterica]EDT8008629.1 phage major capsid protein [Salmonella enterica subsp. enterica]
MKKLIELRRSKATKYAEMRAIVEKTESEKRSMSDDEIKQFDAIKVQVDALNEEIQRYEDLIDLEREDGKKPVDDKGTRSTVSNAELRNYITTGETRALSTATGADGGYTVIPELDKEIMRRVTDDSVMRRICTVKTTSSGTYKKLVSVGGAGVNHGEEGKDRSETATPQLEEVAIPLYPIYAYPKTTQEILDFSEVDILGWLSEEVADTFTETEDTDLVSGDGAKKSKGFLAYPLAVTNDKTRAFGTLQKHVVAEISSDAVIDLLYKLKSKYRKNAVWAMNSNTAAALQKLKNGNGDYIWRDRLAADAPDMLLGRPVEYLETLPDAEAGKACLAVGDFKRGYYIVDHETGVRTRPDNITEPGFYKVNTDKYLGGGVVDSCAIKVLEIA